MSPLQQELQNWTGGALNIIRLIGMNSTFAQILGKFERKNVKIQPCAQPTDLPKTGQVL